MGNTSWKNEERRVAELLHGKRVILSYPFDVETDQFLVEVKYRAGLPLTALEEAVRRIDWIAQKKGKVGFVVIKRKAGPGIETPRIVAMSMETFLDLHGHKWHQEINECAEAGEKQQTLTHLPKHNTKHKVYIQGSLLGGK